MAATQQITVSNVVSADIDTIMNIAMVCGLCEWSVDDYLREMDRPEAIFLKAERTAGDLVGFVIGRILGRTPDQIPYSEIYNIGVAPELHRLGYGNALLRSYLAVCTSSDVGSVYLEVRSRNSNAIRLYERHGFVRSSIRKGFYTSPNDDALVMKLDVLKKSDPSQKET